MDMGGGRLIRVLIVALTLIVIWKIWEFSALGPAAPPLELVEGAREGSGGNKVPQPQAQPVQQVQADDNRLLKDELEVPVSRLLRVEVFYEALCPDSRSFVMKQLLPAYTALSDIMDVHIVPYGKATTKKDSTGEYVFHCQHGPVECEANRIHACVSNAVQDKAKVLNIVSCMIDRNSNPPKIGQFCVEKFGVAWSDVERCVKSKKGDEILRHMGELTHSLKPQVSFIPTITIDGSQDDQRLILRSFQKVLCSRYKGPKPENCP
ncbi:unnamed protein product [Meganyctiphanes norvegica]|uniref:Gamma-interferon-inducible lysosomal thiol reductase n=1 Tax=Meganyctiphanes norvegica TaxID=48144 RepID=A0AAV2QAF7_MEGNR